MLNLYRTYGTYGLHAINRETFNTRYHDTLYFPRELRNVVVTALRINNLVFNILGYIPQTRIVSGCVRMAIGAVIIAGTMTIGDRNAKEGAIIGRWYDEAIQLGLAQITRGALEALVPYGRIVNATLDIIGTPVNLLKGVEGSMACEECMMGGKGRGNHMRPHQDADYPLPFIPLYLA